MLRYNISAAYVPHYDWIDPDTEKTHNNHDYDSANKGTNRFLTIFLYLSDVEEGGETVFTKGNKFFGNFGSTGTANGSKVDKKVTEMEEQAETDEYLDSSGQGTCVCVRERVCMVYI